VGEAYCVGKGVGRGLDRLSATGRGVLARGGVVVAVRRQGMIQNVDFVVRRFPVGGKKEIVALYTEKFVDVGELERVVEEVGLPVFASNGRVFPKGMGATDFIL